jgi:hypothetical protein
MQSLWESEKEGQAAWEPGDYGLVPCNPETIASKPRVGIPPPPSSPSPSPAAAHRYGSTDTTHAASSTAAGRKATGPMSPMPFEGAGRRLLGVAQQRSGGLTAKSQAAVAASQRARHATAASPCTHASVHPGQEQPARPAAKLTLEERQDSAAFGSEFAAPL